MAALPVAVAVLDAGLRFLFANPEAEQFFGTSVAQLRQMALADLIPPDNPVFLVIGRVRETGATVSERDLTLESPLLQREGVTVEAAPLPEIPGAVVLVLRDASAARRLDRQLGFRSSARSVAGMAASLAHEVKNPLSGIRGAAQLLEQGASVADRALAVLIREEADRIKALVERMEMFGERPIAREAVNIHCVLGHVRRLAEAGFARGVRLREDYDPSLPAVHGNRDQLVQILLNLVKNAAEALAGGEPEGGAEIVLATACRPGLRLVVPGAARGALGGAGRRLDLPLVISVRDNGPGIADDIRPNLFDPFVSSKPDGSGLGLALVAKLVAEHGGLVAFDSRPGRTEFRLHLPMYVEPMQGEPVQAGLGVR